MGIERFPIGARFRNMARKPARIYRAVKGQAYTRKEYMGGTPQIRISEFDIGDPDGDYDSTLHLVLEETCQVRHIALESARIASNRYLGKKAGNKYHMKIRLYPHNVLRENKVVAGAGADRISDGMRHAFGKPIDLAARVKSGQALITLRTVKEFLPFAKEALRKAGSKLPVPSRIVIETT
jgi:large subunit ribosomal protein L10e